MARRIAKRVFDVAFAVVALVVLVPFWLVIAVVIKLDDGGPVFYRQIRVGRGGRPFRLVKLRTMRVGADRDLERMIKAGTGCALLFKARADPRVTRVGAFLRRSSLDETPQFWNVLVGAMSIVGPRPQVAGEVAEYKPCHFRRLVVKPGITGLWQISGRNDLSVEEALLLDLAYVDSWSLHGDLFITAKTVPAVVSGKGAY